MKYIWKNWPLLAAGGTTLLVTGSLLFAPPTQEAAREPSAQRAAAAAAMSSAETPTTRAPEMAPRIARPPQGRVASVLPHPEEERWLQIPWRTDVAQARAESQRTGKPLFFWIMDGNPLGCT